MDATTSAGDAAGGSGSDIDSIGSYLARQRELRGISVEELATLTRIPLRSLERLESGSFDANPDGFVRGFVRTVALALGLDGDATVARMLHEPPGSESRLRPGAPHVGRPAWIAIGLALGTTALAASLALINLVSAPGAPSVAAVEPESTTVTRRDPVRALAREQADLLDSGFGLQRSGSGERAQADPSAPGSVDGGTPGH